MANPAVTYTFINGQTSDGPQVTQNFSDLVAALTDGLKSLTIANLVVNTNTTLSTSFGGPIYATAGVLASETALSAVRGGTGVANNAAATLTRSGNHALTITTTNTTGVTLPTTGTLATLAGTENLSAKTMTNTCVINGVTNASDAAAGNVGEFISATGADTSGNTQGTVVNVTSISLTAGDWDVDGLVNLSNASVVSPTRFRAGISTVSATIQNGSGGSINFPASSLSSALQASTGRRRISISSTTTIYLVAECSGASGTFNVTGTISFLSARRIR